MINYCDDVNATICIHWNNFFVSKFGCIRLHCLMSSGSPPTCTPCLKNNWTENIREKPMRMIEHEYFPSLCNSYSNLPGAAKISCFFVLMRRKVKSLVGSMSLTQLFALVRSVCSSPAYCTVVELSIVVFIGIPTNNESYKITNFFHHVTQL